MSEFLRRVSTEAALATEESVAAARACLDRFTAAFNACDVAAMDAELVFPHVVWAGAEMMVWQVPGQHPADLFDQLRALGWAYTRYESVEPVLASNDKVHFVIHYTRRGENADVLSEHRNLWIVVKQHGRWGIAVRSY